MACSIEKLKKSLDTLLVSTRKSLGGKAASKEVAVNMIVNSANNPMVTAWGKSTSTGGNVLNTMKSSLVDSNAATKIEVNGKTAKADTILYSKLETPVITSTKALDDYIEEVSSNKFDIDLDIKLRKILKKLYPEIKLEYTEDSSQQIKGQADINAKTVPINSLLQSQDILPHEYAHHYIAMFRNAPIVQEAIKKWGSEEALVQAIGEQVVEQKGEVYNWWKRFSKWVQELFDNLSKQDKDTLKNLLTDSFLTAQDLDTYDTMSDDKQQMAGIVAKADIQMKC